MALPVKGKHSTENASAAIASIYGSSDILIPGMHAAICSAGVFSV
jgi:hypothetical protein